MRRFLRNLPDHILWLGGILLILTFGLGRTPDVALGANQQSIRSIEKKLSARQKEMKHLKARLVKNKIRLKRYRGKRLGLKVEILKLRVRVEGYHLKIEKLHIKEIRDRRAIRRLEKTISRLDGTINADLQQKESLESRLLTHRAEMALSQFDGTDISPDTVLRSLVLSSQTRHLSTLVHHYQHKKNRLKVSRNLLFGIRNQEERLLKKREKRESVLKKDMQSIQGEIAKLKKREQSIHDDNRFILKRRRKLMGLIARLERIRKNHKREVYHHPPVVGHSLFQWPVVGRVVEKYGTFHDGIDIAAPVGSRVHAAWTGKVLFARAYSGYGRLVILGHGNHLYTLYGHLDRIYAHEGQHISVGNVIGTVGQGGTQGQPTLFFGVTRHGKPLSPMKFLSRR